jgi:transcriptional regulator with XRE-family HTH domain
MNKKFGALVQQLRKSKGWTVKELIEKLGGQVSPAYMTKVEVYGEIPSPELICKIADILGYDQKTLLEVAKENKVDRFEKALEEKYQKAVGMYRMEKSKDDESKK